LLLDKSRDRNAADPRASHSGFQRRRSVATSSSRVLSCAGSPVSRLGKCCTIGPGQGVP
jgi:hypothetical protein